MSLDDVLHPVGTKVRYGAQRGGEVVAVLGDRRRVKWPKGEGTLIAKRLRPDVVEIPVREAETISSPVGIPRHLWPDA